MEAVPVIIATSSDSRRRLNKPPPFTRRGNALKAGPRLHWRPQTGDWGWRRWLSVALVLILCAAAVLLVRYRPVWVIGNSMRPTLTTGDLLVVDTFAYRRLAPARGDIVVARRQGELIVKRIVGLPGERIEVRHGRVEIDGVREITDYDVEPGWLQIAQGTLMDDRYAILGDNRSVDPSSFIHAVVASSQILGKVVLALKWRY